MPRDAKLSLHNLVLGGAATTHRHDAAMRISGKLGAAGPFCGTAKARYLPRYTATSDHDRTFTVSLENADIVSFHSPLCSSAGGTQHYTFGDFTNRRVTP